MRKYALDCSAIYEEEKEGAYIIQNYDTILCNTRSRDIAVSIVSGSWDGWPRNCGPLPCRGEGYSDFEIVEISTGSHAAYN
jgi:hypothetical protein